VPINYWDDDGADQESAPDGPAGPAGAPGGAPLENPAWVAELFADAVLVTGDESLARRIDDVAATADVRIHRVADPLPDQATPADALAVPPAVAPRARLLLLGADAAVRLAGHPSLPELPAIVVTERKVPAEVWHAALVIDAEQVLLLPDAETWLVSRLMALRDTEPPRARIVGVTGGRGGAGASVLSAALARTAAARGRGAMLVDADPMGGGSDILLGAEDEPGLRWPDLAAARGTLATDVLREGLPLIDGVHVVSCDPREPDPPPPEAMRALLAAGGRMVDLLVVDLPRSPDGAAEVALEACDLALLVVPAEVRAAVSARRSATLLRRRVVDVRLVVRGPSPAGLSAKQIAAALDVPLAGWLQPEKGLAAALDRGEPPGLRPRGPLARFCTELLADPALSPGLGEVLLRGGQWPARGPVGRARAARTRRRRRS
jgi:secretion/DNA translocation related CpaE-like protein